MGKYPSPAPPPLPLLETRVRKINSERPIQRDKEDMKEEGWGGKKKQGTRMEGGGEEVSEKALSRDPPAGDFLRLMYSPFFLFTAMQSCWTHCIFLGNTQRYLYFKQYCCRTTEPCPALSAQQLTAKLLLIGTNVTLERWGGGVNRGPSLAEAMQRQYDANAT